jgi:hypothetical protein
VDDFVEYWSASRLLILGRNPYSPEELFALQRGAGSTADVPLMMWNPPWTLTFTLAFGVLNYPLARLLWLVLNLLFWVFCIEWGWRWAGIDEKLRWWYRIVAYSFLPGIVVIFLGQISLLILAGIAAFLGLERRHLYWQAGVVSVLLGFKPQLLYLFWISFFLTALSQKKKSMIGGAMCGFLAACILPVVFRPAVFFEYGQSVFTHAILHFPTPTLGSCLRLAFGWQNRWLAYFPMAGGLLWLMFYWRKYQENWNWSEHLPVILLISLLTTAYAWMFDQIVLLPALAVMVGTVIRSGSSRLAVIAGFGFWAVNIIGAGMILLRSHPVAYFWTTPAWLIGYLALSRLNTTDPTPPRCLPDQTLVL